MWQLSSTNLMSCCYSSFELLLLDTWPSACYQRVDVLSQLYLIPGIIIRQLLTCRVPVNDLGDSRTAKMIPVAS